MKNKTKQRKRYNKGLREDYTQGGRVGYQRGDEVRYEDNLRGQLNKAVDTVKAQQPIEQTPVEKTTLTPAPTPTPAPTQQPVAQTQTNIPPKFQTPALRDALRNEREIARDDRYPMPIIDDDIGLDPVTPDPKKEFGEERRRRIARSSRSNPRTRIRARSNRATT